jgi:phage baseplate assembly protein W
VRDEKNDFAHASGVELVAAAIGQVLGTLADTGVSRGELPWRTEFGSALELLRHRNVDDVWRALADVYVRQAIQRWEPRAIVKQTIVEEEVIGGEAHVQIQVVFSVASSNTPGSAIVASDLVASVQFS